MSMYFLVVLLPQSFTAAAMARLILVTARVPMVMSFAHWNFCTGVEPQSFTAREMSNVQFASPVAMFSMSFVQVSLVPPG